jgi:hypothetical protein
LAIFIKVRFGREIAAIKFESECSQMMTAGRSQEMTPRKDKPIAAPGRPGHPQLAKLPEWPAKTVAVLCTTDGGPHAIPVATPVRAGDQRILVSLERTRGSLARLRENPQVALAILGAGNVAFTALGRARIVQESMPNAPEFVAVEIDVEKIDDHRSPGVAVESGVRVQFADDADHSLQKRIDVLWELSEQKG